MNAALLARTGVLGALAFLFMRLELPIVPGYGFLKYDPSNLPAVLAAFVLGLPTGLAVAALRSLLHALVSGDAVGSAMALLASALYLVPAERWYRRHRDFRGGLVALAAGTVAMALGMIPANRLVIALFDYMPPEAAPFYCLAVVPAFNVVKGTLDGLLLLLVYKRAGALLKPRPKTAAG